MCVCVCEREREERERETSGARGRLHSDVRPVRACGIRPRVPRPVSVCIYGVLAGEYLRGWRCAAGWREQEQAEGPPAKKFGQETRCSPRSSQ